MKLLSLHLRNFRNYEEASLSFSAGINAIMGRNGQGKTNLLEALFVLLTGRSFRTSSLSELVRFGESSFYLEAHFEKNEVNHTLKISCNGKERKILFNSTPLSKLSDLLGLISGVLVSPDDSALIDGEPKFRRKFLDLHIAKVDPSFLDPLSRYAKALKYRNHLLRLKETSQIRIWEEELATSGAKITLEREKAISELNEQASILKLNSLKGDRLELSYKMPSQDLASYYRDEFEKNREKELILGITLSGPHRDDFRISLKGKKARSFGSEGQKRTALMALRLAEWTRLKNKREEDPLFCIDDLGLSLDKERKKEFVEIFETLGQVFFTTPFEESLFPRAAPFHVENGRLI